MRIMDRTNIAIALFLIACFLFAVFNTSENERIAIRAAGKRSPHSRWIEMEPTSAPRAARVGTFSHLLPEKIVAKITGTAPAPAPAIAGKLNDVANAKARNAKRKRRVAKNMQNPQKPLAKAEAKREAERTPEESLNPALGGAGILAPAAPQEPTTKTAKTQQEWELYLLESPDYDRTMEFVLAYQSSQVTTTEFYTIMGEMLSDRRDAMRSLGVLALTDTPSTNSYIYLQNQMMIEPGGTQTKSLINAALNHYTTPGAFSILAQIASNDSNPALQMSALQQITTMINRNRIAKAPHTRMIRGQQAAHSAALYNQVVSLLQGLAQREPHTPAGQLAGQTLKNVTAI